MITTIYNQFVSIPIWQQNVILFVAAMIIILTIIALVTSKNATLGIKNDPSQVSWKGGRIYR